MGTSCATTQPAGPPNVRHEGPFTVYGDYFNSDTWAILAVCNHANIEHEFKLVDSLAK